MLRYFGQFLSNSRREYYKDWIPGFCYGALQSRGTHFFKKKHFADCSIIVSARGKNSRPFWISCHGGFRSCQEEQATEGIFAGKTAKSPWDNKVNKATRQHLFKPQARPHSATRALASLAASTWTGPPARSLCFPCSSASASASPRPAPAPPRRSPPAPPTGRSGGGTSKSGQVTNAPRRGAPNSRAFSSLELM